MLKERIDTYREDNYKGYCEEIWKVERKELDMDVILKIYTSIIFYIFDQG